jgi:flavin-binding protein dodecin
MAESVYKIIELVGTSTESWEKAAAAAVTRASKTLRDLRVAEVVQLDLQISDGKVEAYRAKLKVSFKYEGGQCAASARAGCRAADAAGGVL